MTRRLPPLNRAMPTAYVEMHPDDAKDANIRQGETITIQSRRGVCDLPVWIDGRGRPPRGTLFVPFFDETKLINNCTLEAYDPFSKQPDYKKCAARVVKKKATESALSESALSESALSESASSGAAS